MPRSGDRIREKQTEDRKRKKEVSPEKEVSSGSDDGWKELDEELNNLGQSSPKHDGAGSSSFTASELAGKIDEGQLQWQRIIKDHRSSMIPTGISSREKGVSNEKKKTDTSSTKTAEKEKQDNIIRKIKEKKLGDLKWLSVTFNQLKNHYKNNNDDKHYKYNAIYTSFDKLNSFHRSKNTTYDPDLLECIKDLHSILSKTEGMEEDLKEIRRAFPKSKINDFLDHFKSIVDANPD